MVEAAQKLTTEQKQEMKAKAKEMIMTKTVEELAAIGNKRTREETMAYFSMFDDLEDMKNFNKDLPMAKLAELQTLWTQEYIEIMKDVMDTLFSDRKEWSRKYAADWMNTASEDELKAVLGKKNKANHAEFYKVFDSKKQYYEWLMSLKPDKRSYKSEYLTKEQQDEDKQAFEEVFGPQYTVEEKAEKRAKYKELLLTKTVDEIAEVSNKRTLSEQLAHFAMFDDMTDYATFLKDIPVEKTAELQSRATPEAIKVAKEAINKLFGNRKEWSRKHAADWINNTPVEEMKVVFAKKNKQNSLEFYKVFDSKKQYTDWLLTLKPERRSYKDDYLTEKQKEEDKKAFEEIFGPQYTTEEKADKRAKHKEFMLTKSIDEIAAVSNNRTLEENLAHFSLFDDMQDYAAFIKELPMEKMAELQTRATPEGIKVAKEAIDKLFGNRKEWSKQHAADWINTAPEEEMKMMLAKKTKINFLELYKIFDRVEEYKEWELALKPERRDYKQKYFNEAQLEEDKQAYREVFGVPQKLSAEEKTKKRAAYKELLLTKSVDEIAEMRNNFTYDHNLEHFSMFDDMDDYVAFVKELPMDKMAELQALATPAAVKVAKKAIDALFGNQKEWSRNHAREWINNASVKELKTILPKKSKINHVQFYKIFDNKEQYNTWVENLKPERRNIRHKYFSEEQIKEDKQAFEEVFGTSA